MGLLLLYPGIAGKISKEMCFSLKYAFKGRNRESLAKTAGSRKEIPAPVFHKLQEEVCLIDVQSLNFRILVKSGSPRDRFSAFASMPGSLLL